MDRNFLKQSIRRELDYYKDGLFNEDEDEYWERAWAAPDDDDSMAENGFLNVAMAHLQGDECDEIVLLGTEYGYHQPDYDSYIDGVAFHRVIHIAVDKNKNARIISSVSVCRKSRMVSIFQHFARQRA